MNIVNLTWYILLKHVYICLYQFTSVHARVSVCMYGLYPKVDPNRQGPAYGHWPVSVLIMIQVVGPVAHPCGQHGRMMPVTSS